MLLLLLYLALGSFSILPNQSTVWTYHRVEHIDWRTILILPGFQTFHLHEFLTKYYLKKKLTSRRGFAAYAPGQRKTTKKHLNPTKKPPPRQRHVPQINNSMKNDSPQKNLKKRCHIKKVLLNDQNYASIHEIQRKMT